MVDQRARRQTLFAALALAITTSLVYARTSGYEFLYYDDPDYVFRNEHVLGGLTWQGLRWAVTSTHAANWFPLTWASHMLDVTLFGLWPGGHHMTSVALHVANALLLLQLLVLATGRVAPAALVAGLFALHPLHVESVAWVAERKDVLSTFFALLTALAYVGWTRRRGRLRYATVLLLFALALASKPMVITLPALLLLLDVWPLARITGLPVGLPGTSEPTGTAVSPGRALAEKLPLFVLSLGSALITLAVQEPASIEVLSLAERMTSVPLAYLTYVAMAVWPVDLAALYPHPGRSLSPLAGGLAWLALFAVSAGCLAAGRRHPWLGIGWLWFVGMLVPVIGFVQVGRQFIADRYTYLPLVGLFIGLAWTLDLLVWRQHTRRRVLAGSALALALLTACGVGTWNALPAWRDTYTLFNQALRVTRANDTAHLVLGIAHGEDGRVDEQLVHWSAATLIRRENAVHLYRLGQERRRLGDARRAERAFRSAISHAPEFAEARVELSGLLRRAGDMAGARAQVELALEVDPRNARALVNLGLLELEHGAVSEAAAHMERALAIEPDLPQALVGTARVRIATGDRAGAVEALERALALRPRHRGARALLQALDAAP